MISFIKFVPFAGKDLYAKAPILSKSWDFLRERVPAANQTDEHDDNRHEQKQVNESSE